MLDHIVVPERLYLCVAIAEGSKRRLRMFADAGGGVDGIRPPRVIGKADRGTRNEMFAFLRMIDGKDLLSRYDVSIFDDVVHPVDGTTGEGGHLGVET